MATISFSSTNSGSENPQKEAEVQKRCWSWLETKHVGKDEKGVLTLQMYSYMVPNGTQLGGSHRGRARYMASLKAQGFKNGVSDIVIAYPVRKDLVDSSIEFYHGAYIELKRDREAYKGPAAIRSAVRDEQLAWLKLMRSAGYWVGVAYGLEEFKQAVESFLAGEEPPPLPGEE